MKLAIYLAGPITGLDESEAFEAFALAERFIADKGHEPLNPMKLVDQAGDRAYEEYLLDALRERTTITDGFTKRFAACTGKGRQ